MNLYGTLEIRQKTTLYHAQYPGWQKVLEGQFHMANMQIENPANLRESKSV